MARMSKQAQQEILTLTHQDLQMLNEEGKWGKVLLYYRLKKQWTAEKLAWHYSEGLQHCGIEEDGEPKSTARIYEMENKNKLPFDRQRRLLLAILLDVPLSLWNLSLPHTEKEPGVLGQLFKHTEIDIPAYQKALQAYNQQFLDGALYNALPIFKAHIDTLQDALFLKKGAERKILFQLLCEYQLLLSSIFSEHHLPQYALQTLQKVITIAEEQELWDILAYALRQHAVTHFDQGEIQASLTDYAKTTVSFQAAITDCDRIQTIRNRLSTQRRQHIDLVTGMIYAAAAQDHRAFQQALHLVDSSWHGIGKTSEEENTIATRLDLNRFHLTRGHAWVASPLAKLRFPRQALREYSAAADHVPPNASLRTISRTTREAEAYYLSGNIDMTLSQANITTELLRKVPSDYYRTRIENLYDLLQESIPGTGELAQLRLSLFQVKYPTLFP